MRFCKDEAARHEFAAAGCTFEEFSRKFGVRIKTAHEWMREHGYQPSSSESAEIDISPRTIECAYYALMIAILTDLNAKQALRRMAW
jgi:hypothetical protein